MNMKKYLYQVENGELSFDFEAPLLGDIGDYVSIYADVENCDKTFRIEEFSKIRINAIDFDNQIVSCAGDID